MTADKKQLRFENDKFIWVGGYETREIAKSAGMRWNADDKIWETKIASVALRLAAYADNATIEIINKKLEEENGFVAASSSSVASENFSVDCPSGRKFFQFQVAGIEYAVKKESVLIADEMGLGKTCQAIGVINCVKDAKKILIVCPASLKINWR